MAEPKDLGIERARQFALESDEYKNGNYHIGDKIHICDGEVECDGILSDVIMIYNMEFKSMIAYIVTLEDGTERMLHSVDSIKFKY